MAQTPMVRSASWVMALPPLILLSGAIFLADRILRPVDFNVAAMAGASAFVLYSIGVRRLLVGQHRRGVSLVRAEQFGEAITHFEASYGFLSRHAWIDRWRCLTLLSASAISYREMALCNIAFCYGQVGDGRSCKSYYERALSEFPESGLAQASLNIILAAEASAQR